MKKIVLVLAFLLLSVTAWAADYSAVSVGGTAVSIYTAGSSPRAIGVIMCNASASVTAYFGNDSSVTSSTYGFPLAAGACVILNGHLNSWWAVTAGSTATISYQILY